MGGEVGGEALEKGSAGGRDLALGIGQEESFEAIDLATEAEGGLESGEIGNGEVVVGPEKIGGRFEQKTDVKKGLVTGGMGEDGVTGLKLKTLGERTGQRDGVGFRDEGDGIGGGAKGVFEAVGDEFAVGKGVDPDEVKKFARVPRK